MINIHKNSVNLEVDTNGPSTVPESQVPTGSGLERWSQVGQTGKFAQSFRYNPSIKQEEKKKVFKLGCAEAGAGGGVEHLVGIFILSAQHRRSLQLEAEKKNFKDVFYLDFKNVLLREKVPYEAICY